MFENVTLNEKTCTSTKLSSLDLVSDNQTHLNLLWNETRNSSELFRFMSCTKKAYAKRRFNFEFFCRSPAAILVLF